MDSEARERLTEAELHERLLGEDPTASADLFVHFASSLGTQLSSKFPTTDPDLIHDAVISALLDFATKLERFDPAKRSLGGYLYMIAKGDLLNLRERHLPRLEAEMLLDPVELDRTTRNIKTVGRALLPDEFADGEAAAELVELAMSVAETDEERIVLRLMLAEQRATEAYARALGLEGQPGDPLRKHVYAVKDRLTKRLRRLRRNKAE